MSRAPWFQFGEHRPEYPVPVLNERAVRAGAGILFVLAFIGFMHAWLLGDFRFTRWFVLVFVLDMALRVGVNPRLAPSLILGQWVVRGQTPEWVGAAQKRFAWALGLALGAVMVWLMVISQSMGPLNVLLCGTCLLLMGFESCFGICLGCKLYNLFHKEQAQLCPGGVCELPAQKKGWGLPLPQAAVLLAFAAVLVAAKGWVDRTGPLQGFDDMATLEEMGLKPTPGETSAADAERCQVPAFAKAIGHETLWKQHNGCS